MEKNKVVSEENEVAETFTSCFKTVVENLGIKGALFDLTLYLATESSFTMIKIAFCFNLKALFVL